MVACLRGGRALALTNDQTPARSDERSRVASRGGKMLMGRLNGMIGLTRAFGNLPHKSTPEAGQRWEDALLGSPLTSEPEVRTHDLDALDVDFILIASDAIFDVLSVEEATAVARNALRSGRSPRKAASAIVDAALPLAKDNCTAVLVDLSRREERPGSADGELLLAGRYRVMVGENGEANVSVGAPGW